MTNRIVVAMSGGVDSSVAAALLVREGFDVVGITMQLWDYGSQRSAHAGRCCASEDIEDARRVAHHLKIPFYAINFQKEFMSQVVKPFMEDYLSGRTPSPCVNCNSGLKFHELVKVAQKLQSPRVATGHYARVQQDPATGRYQLRKAADSRKDQSYFLFNLTQQQLSRALFPLGDRTKPEVRALALEMGLPVADKPESMELCFLQGQPQGAFIQKHIPNLAAGGKMVDSNGKEMGEHPGIHHFTIGQRRGLGVSGGEPRYVVDLDPTNKVVTLGSGDDLLRSGMEVAPVNWVGIAAPAGEIGGRVRIRYKHEETPARIFPQDGGCTVRFDEKQRAITPGQAAVFYEGDLVLGGGWISRAL